MAEQGTHKPLVVSSNLILATKKRPYRVALLVMLRPGQCAGLLCCYRRCRMSPDNLPIYISLDRVAEQYNVPPRLLHRAIESGIIKAVKINHHFPSKGDTQGF